MIHKVEHERLILSPGTVANGANEFEVVHPVSLGWDGLIFPSRIRNENVIIRILAFRISPRE